ncbi:hypothetical protein [Flavobacterium sp. HSC-61S13]|uniref:hypothetical protein n=1 Tax=Flavobacterium sp. HSC-61S13 TaxID=2910963 RepID=UPI0020A051BE|nr:hypothetical protein [Flavobacterium sp. HSC-61S13]MCP1995075.1 hypothetical protein [Flavobacterium sp. HSC-61S13]
MKQQLLNFIKYLLLFTIVVGGAQYLFIEFILEPREYYYNTFAIYGFLFAVTLLLFGAILYINSVFSEYTGYAFMASSFFKMILSVLFLLPIIRSDDRSYIADVVVFFIPYFLYLFFETFFVVDLLKDKKEETV